GLPFENGTCHHLVCRFHSNTTSPPLVSQARSSHRSRRREATSTTSAHRQHPPRGARPRTPHHDGAVPSARPPHVPPPRRGPDAGGVQRRGGGAGDEDPRPRLLLPPDNQRHHRHRWLQGQGARLRPLRRPVAPDEEDRRGGASQRRAGQAHRVHQSQRGGTPPPVHRRRPWSRQRQRRGEGARAGPRGEGHVRWQLRREGRLHPPVQRGQPAGVGLLPGGPVPVVEAGTVAEHRRAPSPEELRRYPAHHRVHHREPQSCQHQRRWGQLQLARPSCRGSSRRAAQAAEGGLASFPSHLRDYRRRHVCKYPYSCSLCTYFNISIHIKLILHQSQSKELHFTVIYSVNSNYFKSTI
ncbi:Cytochrome P450 71D7, partial [Zea mays]